VDLTKEMNDNLTGININTRGLGGSIADTGAGAIISGGALESLMGSVVDGSKSIVTAIDANVAKVLEAMGKPPAAAATPPPEPVTPSPALEVTPEIPQEYRVPTGVPEYSQPLPANYDMIAAILKVDESVNAQGAAIVEAIRAGGIGGDGKPVIGHVGGGNSVDDIIGGLLAAGTERSIVEDTLRNFGITNWEWLSNGGIKFGAAVDRMTEAAQGATASLSELIDATSLVGPDRELPRLPTAPPGAAYDPTKWGAYSAAMSEKTETGGWFVRMPNGSYITTDQFDRMWGEQSTPSNTTGMWEQKAPVVTPDWSKVTSWDTGAAWQDAYSALNFSAPKSSYPDVRAGDTIIIQNNVFRSQDDIDYLVKLVRNQL
jgi:hypothetical protein